MRQTEIGELEGVEVPFVQEVEVDQAEREKAGILFPPSGPSEVLNRLPLRRLRRDGGTQLRQTMDMRATQEYAEAIRRGETFPPLVVFDDGNDFWLADGFHRYDAHVLCESAEVYCGVRQGSRQDAILYAAKANRAHGVRLTPADREKIIVTLVNEFPDADQADISRLSGIAKTTVNRVVKRLFVPLGQTTEQAQAPTPLESALAELPPAEQQIIRTVITAPGVPEAEALAAAQNAAAMPPERRAQVCEQITSAAHADQLAAVSALRDMPYVHPLWSRVNTALGHMRQCLPGARGTEFEGAFRIIINHLEGLLESIEASERRTEDATA